ncbi:carboxymuconolactone decarboxylase family protein [Nocardia sp. CNY236]|uniref:carboxymuconolactone decarboxylase family protein n=1 Tax=Nocardia sp. CNY236 TaxID=1169152 RepID=UPI0004910901|nr:carboxymuconolactone decarboxylase family protein [Nocardia sp. CNY236]
MERRMDLHANAVAGSFLKRLNMATRVIKDSALPAATWELVKIRASQINVCGCCSFMPLVDAAHAGETSVRLNMVAAWHEATVFTPAERAALALTEEATRIGDGRFVSDEAWQQVREHYDDDQVAALIAAIATINAWNRMYLVAREPAGAYVPGQWG